jgi:trk system potassium uptake protein TrkA
MILGASRTAFYLSKMLLDGGSTVKIIDQSTERCEEFCEALPEAIIVKGDAAQQEVLAEEGIASADAFAALTGIDEENILLSLYAKDAGSGKQITKITRMDYDSVLSRLELDTVICPKNITADTIVSYVRATTNTKGSNVETLYNIVQDKVEAAEFVIKGNSPVIGKPLHELKFKKDILVASISRGDTVIIPRGNDTILPGDSVIIISECMPLGDITDILK